MFIKVKQHKPGFFASIALVLSLCVTFGCSRLRGAAPEIILSEDLTLPAVTALAWLNEERFVSVSADGVLREWDIYTGLVYAAEETETGTAVQGSVLSGTKKLIPLDDGGISLVDTGTGNEFARYYGRSGEWVSIVPQGFFNASFGGTSLLSVKTLARLYKLDQLSGALFRPDLFKALLKSDYSGVARPPMTLESLLSENNGPPLVSVLSVEGRKLKLKITEQKGGTGLLALYSRSDEEEVPIGLFDVETAVQRLPGKKFTEKGKTCYEIELDVSPGEMGVSAFNKNNTIESEKLWLEIKALSVESAVSDSLPVLKVFFAAGDGDKENVERLREFLSLQTEGDLYSAVDLKSIPGGILGSSEFLQSFDQFCRAANKNDVAILYLEGRSRLDELGNIVINENKGEEILKSIFLLPQDTLLLFNLESEAARDTMETGLLRFRRMLGPKALFAGFNAPPGSFIDAVMEGLSAESFGITEMSFGKNYVSNSKLFAKTGLALLRQGGSFLAFSPRKDFNLADPFIGAGELKFQTMTSGMLRIDRVDANPVPLVFGETMRRTLPPGSYIIDMIYRNGYRETRTAELKTKGSVWVIFSYTPSLLVGDFSGSLPSLGINLSELNPANYEKINREAMEGMGMAPYYVAYLAGEKFYKEGNYDNAIAEYDRSLALKSDYVDSFISRGNAKRRKADFNGAIADYDRALRLKDGNADVYNYRGFMYAQKGDFGRAVDDYTRAIRYRPNYADAFFNRAYAYGKQGNWEKAIADYTRVIELEPSNASAYNGRGSAWNNKGDEEKAASDFAAAEGLKDKR